MKKTLLLSLIIFICYYTNGQVSSLSENFNKVCASFGKNYPEYWNEYNVINPTSNLGWSCSPTGGRWGTPGIYCSGFYSDSSYLDSAWFFTPQINLSGYSGNIYLTFDSKYEINPNSLQTYVYLHRIVDSTNSPIDSANNSYVNVTGGLYPTFSLTDSLAWVTHQINLTPFKYNNYVYVAFLYVSADSLAGIWTLDNINTNIFSLDVSETDKSTNTILLSANNVNSNMNVTYKVPSAGKYELDLLDITGRQVVQQNIDVFSESEEHYTVSTKDLSRGIYLLKMRNSNSCGIIKVVVD